MPGGTDIRRADPARTAMSEATCDLTIPVREAHRFDEAALARYLTAQGALQGRASVRQFRGGQSNPTFLVEADSRRLVLRKKPGGALLPSAHLIEREYAVQSALAATGVPVPKMLLLCEDSGVIGTSFYVMEFLEGRVFADPRLPAMSPGERGAVFAAMVRTLAALHRVVPAEVGLASFGKPQGYVRRQIETWTRQYRASATGEVDAMSRLIEWLPGRIPERDETSIIHGDYRLGNLVLHPQETRVIGVLDWELSTLGHPLADLAYNCLAYDLPAGAETLPGLAGVDLADKGIPSPADYVAEYARLTGREAIADWPFFLAFAAFRFAAICQGVYARSLQGNASDAAAGRYGAIAIRLAELGWRHASGAAG